jgi:hypothetical protein
MVNFASANPRLPGAWAPPRLVDAVTDLLVTEGNRVLRMESGVNRIKSVTAGDFNGDGKKDIFAASGAYSLAENQSVGHELFLNRMEPGSLPRLRDSWLSWLMPAPQGSFPADLRSDSGTTCVQTNDINGDGVSDLLVVRSGNPNPVSWLNQAGSDEDQELADLKSQRSSLADEQPRRLNAAQTGLAYPVTYRVRVLLGRATNDPDRAELVELAVPALVAVQNSHPGTRSFDCRLEDVTGDGRPDLVLGGYTFGNETYAPSSQKESGNGWSHTYWMNEAKGVQVLRNTPLADGFIDFAQERVTPIRVKNYSLEVLDWSGTGRMDIYLGNASQSRLLIRE